MRMRVAKSVESLAGEVNANCYGHPPPIEQIPQGGSFDEVHDHHKVVFVPERVMDGHNVRMIETRLDPYLTQKPVGLLLSLRTIDFHDFERFDSLGDPMLGFEDSAHRPAAQPLENGVIADRFYGREAHREIPNGTTDLCPGKPGTSRRGDTARANSCEVAG